MQGPGVLGPFRRQFQLMLIVLQTQGLGVHDPFLPQSRHMLTVLETLGPGALGPFLPQSQLMLTVLETQDPGAHGQFLLRSQHTPIDFKTSMPAPLTPHLRVLNELCRSKTTRQLMSSENIRPVVASHQTNIGANEEMYNLRILCLHRQLQIRRGSMKTFMCRGYTITRGTILGSWSQLLCEVPRRITSQLKIRTLIPFVTHVIQVCNGHQKTKQFPLRLCHHRRTEKQ